MSEKAMGTDWRKFASLQLRHCAGEFALKQLKKEDEKRANGTKTKKSSAKKTTGKRKERDASSDNNKNPDVKRRKMEQH